MTVKVSKPTISLIVPALNEEANIERTVQETLKAVEGRFSDYEILLLNDGSTDSTGAIMEQLANQYDKIRVFHNKRNLGLGNTYKRGVGVARFEYAMIVYGDGGVPGDSLPAIFDRIGRADIVIPYMVNLKQIKTPMRLLTSWGYTTLLNLLFGHRVRYYNGPSVHRLDLLRQINITSTGFAFQGEIIVKLLKLGCSYTQVGVRGAVGRERSSALRPSNLASVGKTLFDLVWGVRQLDRRAGMRANREARRRAI